MGIYKSLLPNLDGYLTMDAKLVLKNVEKFFARIAKIEEDQFKKYHSIKIENQQNNPERDHQRLSEIFLCNQVKLRADITVI